MRTRVCITIDTEFSIAGAFSNPDDKPMAEQRVWCEVNRKSEGLAFMLDCFSRHSIPATFFVEALQRRYFKHDPMAPIARQLRTAGHEVQLHLHPCWSIFDDDDWKVRIQDRETRRHADDFVGRAEDDTVRLLEYGKEVFDNWGVPAPTVFRSAGLQHDDILYRALARTGIPFSSNVGLAIFDSGDPSYGLYAGRHVRHGVIECPVLTFSDWQIPGKTHLKTLTVTGTSFAETRLLLDRANKEGFEQVVILTHPFEYVQSLNSRFRRIRPHRVNQRRLAKLCRYLDASRDRFLPCGMDAAAREPMRANSSHNLLLAGSTVRAAARIVEQVVYERYSLRQLAKQVDSALEAGAVIVAEPNQ
jgi:peptidoglycan/xylan/chitin deacetylase (PgdA/CDA1 family)